MQAPHPAPELAWAGRDVEEEGDLPWLLLRLTCQLVTVTFRCLAPRSEGLSLSFQVRQEMSVGMRDSGSKARRETLEDTSERCGVSQVCPTLWFLDWAPVLSPSIPPAGNGYPSHHPRHALGTQVHPSRGIRHSRSPPWCKSQIPACWVSTKRLHCSTAPQQRVLEH